MAKKGLDGKLTPRGEEQGKEFGEKLEPTDAVKAYGGFVERAARTAENAVEASRHGKKMKQRLRAELSIPPMSEEAMRKFRELTKERAGAGAEWFLSFDDERPDPETASPREVAGGVAHLVKTYIDMADRLFSGSEIDLVNGTHEVMAESLLRYALIREENDEKKIGFESVKEIGGSLGFVEEIEFRIVTNETGEKTVKVYLRGNEYDIDMGILEGLAKEYRNKKQGAPR